MTTNCPTGYEPDRPQEYKETEEFPFVPDDPNPVIGGCVELVKGVSGPFVGLQCVRKSVLQEVEADKDALKRMLTHEAKVLHSARHNHVVKLIHTYFHCRNENIRFCIIMDRADTSLRDYTIGLGRTKAKRPNMKWFGCLIAATQHIHSLGIRHRDIKPTNILVKNDHVMLADFGISSMGLGKTMPTTNLARNAPGTKQYCAPEVDKGRTRGRSADIFSLGAVLLEMYAACCSPQDVESFAAIFKARNEFFYARSCDEVLEWISQRTALHEDSTWQYRVLSLCLEMLEPDKEKRPTAEALDLGRSLACTCANFESDTKDNQLIAACKSGSRDVLQDLLNDGASSNTMGAIHLAATHDHMDVVLALLSAGADINALNAVGQTPLHCAARNGFDNMVNELLRLEASVNAKDENEYTALHGAAAHGYVDVVRTLLHAGADPDAENRDAETAAYLARGRGHEDVVELLNTWPRR